MTSRKRKTALVLVPDMVVGVAILRFFGKLALLCVRLAIAAVWLLLLWMVAMVRRDLRNLPKRIARQLVPFVLSDFQ